MAEAALKTFIVEREGKANVEVQAERGEQEQGTSRVTFYVGEASVGSFINIQGWYPKAS